jgi:hypothetical protein
LEPPRTTTARVCALENSSVYCHTFPTMSITPNGDSRPNAHQHHQVLDTRLYAGAAWGNISHPPPRRCSHCPTVHALCSILSLPCARQPLHRHAVKAGLVQRYVRHRRVPVPQGIRDRCSFTIPGPKKSISCVVSTGKYSYYSTGSMPRKLRTLCL